MFNSSGLYGPSRTTDTRTGICAECSRRLPLTALNRGAYTGRLVCGCCTGFAAQAGRDEEIDAWEADTAEQHHPLSGTLTVPLSQPSRARLDNECLLAGLDYCPF